MHFNFLIFNHFFSGWYLARGSLSGGICPGIFARGICPGDICPDTGSIYKQFNGQTDKRQTHSCQCASKIKIKI